MMLPSKDKRIWMMSVRHQPDIIIASHRAFQYSITGLDLSQPEGRAHALGIALKTYPSCSIAHIKNEQNGHVLVFLLIGGLNGPSDLRVQMKRKPKRPTKDCDQADQQLQSLHSANGIAIPLI